MCNAAEQIDLPRLTRLDQNVLGLVTELSGEDVVDFGGSDRKRTSDGSELLLGDKGGMSCVTDVDLTGLQEAADILSTEAVTDTSDSLDSQVLSEVLDCRLDNRVDGGGLMLRKPCGKISLSGFHVTELDSVLVEEIGNNSEVSIGSEFVGKQLGVDIDTENVAQYNNGLLGAPVILGV